MREPEEGSYCRIPEFFRYSVRAVEFVVMHRQIMATQDPQNAPAAAIDGQYLVARSVTHEDDGLIFDAYWSHETGRESQNVTKKQTVAKPDRQSIRRAVRKSSDGYVFGVD